MLAEALVEVLAVVLGVPNAPPAPDAGPEPGDRGRVGSDIGAESRTGAPAGSGRAVDRRTVARPARRRRRQ